DGAPRGLRRAPVAVHEPPDHQSRRLRDRPRDDAGSPRLDVSDRRAARAHEPLHRVRPRADRRDLSPVLRELALAAASVDGRSSRREKARGLEGGAWREDLRSEEHTSELQSRGHLVCRLLLEKKKELTEMRGSKQPFDNL